MQWRLSLVLLTVLAALVSAKVNVTIDDTYGDEVTGQIPTYSAGCNRGSTCGDQCAVHLDQSKLYKNDWHDCRGNISFTFNGTDLYLFFVQSDVYNTSVTLFFDGHNVGSYLWGTEDTAPTDSPRYNLPFLSMEDLDYEEHTVLLSSLNSHMLFDYASYSVDSAPSTHKTPVGAIAGGVIGGVAGLALIITAGVFAWRRRRTSAAIIQREKARPDGMDDKLELAPRSPPVDV